MHKVNFINNKYSYGATLEVISLSELHTADASVCPVKTLKVSTYSVGKNIRIIDSLIYAPKLNVTEHF